jgi:hypothetical protein
MSRIIRDAIRRIDRASFETTAKTIRASSRTSIALASKMHSDTSIAMHGRRGGELHCLVDVARMARSSDGRDRCGPNGAWAWSDSRMS